MSNKKWKKLKNERKKQLSDNFKIFIKFIQVLKKYFYVNKSCFKKTLNLDYFIFYK
jgi:hypothetical protein